MHRLIIFLVILISQVPGVYLHASDAQLADKVSLEEPDANTVVIGKVKHIHVSGRTKNSECGIKAEKFASLKAIEYLKHTGSTDKELSIQFWEPESTSDCSEQPSHALRKGEEGVYYLNCKWVTECQLVEWREIKDAR